LSSVDLGFFVDDNGLGTLLGGHLIDPLEYQSVDLAYTGSEFGTQNAFARYSFTKYLPQFFALYAYNRDFWDEPSGREHRGQNQWIQTGALLPVLRWREWDAELSLAGVYHKRERETREETYGAAAGAAIRFQENPSPALGMFPHRSFDLNFLNRLESWPNGWSKRYNTSLVQTQYRQEFGNQVYAALSGAVAWAENQDVQVEYNPYPFNQDIVISRLTPHDEYTVQTASSARFELTKVFKLLAYSPRIPAGLDRIAPFAVAQGIFMDDGGAGRGEYPASVFEWGYGADLQILLLHSLPTQVRLLRGYDTRHPETASDEARFSLHYDF
jgi:hypothetical protein